MVQEALIRLGADPVRHRPHPGGCPMATPRLPQLCYLTAGGLKGAGDSGPSGGGAPELASRPHQPDEEWLPRENCEAVRAILDTLSERHRAVLPFRYSGYSYAEVAASLEMLLSSVGATSGPGRVRLRTRYEEQSHDLS